MTAPPEDAESGGTLEVIAAGDVDYIDPGAQYYQFSYMLANASQRTLVSWPPAETKEPQPDLAAEEPEVSEDGLTITFTIRDGVMFSPPVDREVTAADVEYAIERSILPGVANFYVPGYLTDVTASTRRSRPSRRTRPSRPTSRASLPRTTRRSRSSSPSRPRRW